MDSIQASNGAKFDKTRIRSYSNGENDWTHRMNIQKTNWIEIHKHACNIEPETNRFHASNINNYLETNYWVHVVHKAHESGVRGIFHELPFYLFLWIGWRGQLLTIDSRVPRVLLTAIYIDQYKIDGAFNCKSMSAVDQPNGKRFWHKKCNGNNRKNHNKSTMKTFILIATINQCINKDTVIWIVIHCHVYIILNSLRNAYHK